MEGSSNPSHPPSEPRPSRPRPGESAQIDLTTMGRPARLQMFAAATLIVVLAAIPLYLWRRPRAVVEPAREDAGDAPPLGAGDAGPPLDPIFHARRPIEMAAVTLANSRVIECHDGTKRVPAADCDHLVPIEKALATAIESAGTCVPASAGGGTLEYVADVSFARKKNPVLLSMPREVRTLKSNKVASVCATAVKHAFATPPLDFPHAHARYKVSILATYPGPPVSGK